MKAPLDRVVLFALLLVVAGLGLRLWGIDFGLPFSYANDEYHEVMRALELGSGGFNLERTGKGGFYYLLFVEYAIYFVWLRLTGAVHSAAEFAQHFVRDPSAFYYMGRCTAAAFGALTIGIVFLAGRKAHSVAAGMLAAIFLCVNALHVDLSHRIGVDIPMTCLTAATLYFALKLAVDGSVRDYAWAAFFAALATTTKLPGALLILPLLIAHTYYVRRASGGARQWFASRELWISAALFLVVLVSTNPGIVVDPDLLSPFAGDDQGAVGDDAGDFAAEDMIGALRPNLFGFYLRVLCQSMGLPLFVISMAAVAHGLWKRTAFDMILIPFAALFYVLISSTSSDVLYYPRYALPIIVVLAMLSGRLLSELWQMLPRRHAIVATALTGALIAIPATHSIEASHLLTATDTRTLAKEWIEANVPDGARILIEGLKIKPVKGTVPLKDSAQSMRRRIEYWRHEEPKQAKFLQLELQVLEGKTFNLELVNVAEIESLDDYAQRSVQYFVIRPVAFLESRRRDAGSVRLVEDLRRDPRVTLVKAFRPDPRRTPGPAIEIYKLNRAQ